MKTYIYEGDEVELAGTIYEAKDGELVEVDERDETEKRLDDLEARVEKLENPPWTPTITFPPDDGTTPYPSDLYIPPPDIPRTPYIPGITWISTT